MTTRGRWSRFGSARMSARAWVAWEKLRGKEGFSGLAEQAVKRKGRERVMAMDNTLGRWDMIESLLFRNCERWSTRSLTRCSEENYLDRAMARIFRERMVRARRSRSSTAMKQYQPRLSPQPLDMRFSLESKRPEEVAMSITF